ncbi:MAG: ABC transporter ATP-binding protein [Nitrososphaerales archaeon]
MPTLVVDHVNKTFVAPGKNGGKVEILRGVSFSVDEGQIVSLIGPTGCGKTTLLRIIDGLIPPDSGQVMVNGKQVKGPRDSSCAMVFQRFNLLPWRNALKNVEFGLEAKGVEPKEREQLARGYLSLVGLSGYEKYYPHLLSGGMQQRVGLARAIAIKPDVILLDEPFSSVDLLRRESLQNEVLKILTKTKETGIFVTHNVEEAVFLSDAIISLGTRPGRVKAIYDVNLPRASENDSDAQIVKTLQERKNLIESRSEDTYKLILALKKDLVEGTDSGDEQVGLWPFA